MGELENLAKKNSNWLQIETGKDVTVKYMGFQIIPSELDPAKEIVQYKVEENGDVKFWKNGSGRIMKAFDGFEKGKTWVKITRNPWLDKQGNVVAGKTSYEAEAVDAPPAKEQAWDENL